MAFQKLKGEGEEGSLKIVNESECSFRKTGASSELMLEWENGFPERIEPKTEAVVKVAFDMGKYNPLHKENVKAEVHYEVFDARDLSLATFTIKADALDSSPVNFCAKLTVDWETLPGVFGLSCQPKDGPGGVLGFKKGKEVSMSVTGSLLPDIIDGPKDPNSQYKLTEFKPAEEAAKDCVFGDIIAVNRGPISHVGVIMKVEEDGTVMVCHLTGTAQDALSTHGTNVLKEVAAAMKPGSHGGIARVVQDKIEDFATGDPCRVENLHDEKWKAFDEETLRKRIEGAYGVRDYSLYEFNCEHFANLIRYGMPYSVQIEAFKKKTDLKGRAHEAGENAKKDLYAKRDEAVAKTEEKKEILVSKMNDMSAKLQHKS